MIDALMHDHVVLSFSILFVLWPDDFTLKYLSFRFVTWSTIFVECCFNLENILSQTGNIICSSHTDLRSTEVYSISSRTNLTLLDVKSRCEHEFILSLAPSSFLLSWPKNFSTSEIVASTMFAN